jgi:transposase
VGYDGFKHRKGTKIHVCVDRDSMPLSIIIGPGNEHDSKKLLELVGDLDCALWPNSTSLGPSFVCRILSRMHVY